MPSVIIPETDLVQAFANPVTLPATGDAPAISLLVKCYPGLRWWYMVTYTSSGVILIPARILCTSDNLWDAHYASLKDTYGRPLVCVVQGETDATKPLFAQCTIVVDALSQTAALEPASL